MLTDGVLHPPERLKNRALPGEQMEQLLSSEISLGRVLRAQTGVVRSRVSVPPRHDLSLLTLVGEGGKSVKARACRIAWEQTEG